MSVQVTHFPPSLVLSAHYQTIFVRLAASSPELRVDLIEISVASRIMQVARSGSLLDITCDLAIW
jgi:hypothetical protein